VPQRSLSGTETSDRIGAHVGRASLDTYTVPTELCDREVARVGGGEAPVFSGRCHCPGQSGKRMIKRFEVAGVPVALINMDVACEEVRRRIVERLGGYVIFRDMNGIVLANRDEQILAAHRDAALVAPDGMPLVWLGRRVGYKEMGRVYGPDFLLEFCRRYEGLGFRHFLYGGTDAVVEKLVIELTRLFPNLLICGRYSPPFRSINEPLCVDDVERIRAAKPDLVWVGIGSPKQELLMRMYRPELPGCVLLGVGAAFDFHSKTKAQAPRWIRQSGFEWLFRLLTEPRRLGRRYLLGIPQFLWLLAPRGYRAETAHGRSP
jgi:N-acetylglucosaminyldiphosphoundecaprenol N-acetyl-beta-D-mannosaminyltransferase